MARIYRTMHFIHDWCRDTVDIGTVRALLCPSISRQVYRDIAPRSTIIVDQSFDLMCSIGQVVLRGHRNVKLHQNILVA
ncbi:hypothetical protein [Enterocloster sp.]|uniref:hypothetical protein n=1 Tax=Enterocloster sp. TaxID=2719315 RepID=UPI0039A3342A